MNRLTRPVAADVWMPRPSAGADVYRVYAPDGGLLYVGVTKGITTRFYAHAVSSLWYAVGLRVTVTPYAERWLALEAEGHAIRTEHPVHNIRVPLRGITPPPRGPLRHEEWFISSVGIIRDYRRG